ncbi:MAG: tetratricopeptide repeat protein [Spirochaetota bacterium]
MSRQTIVHLLFLAALASGIHPHAGATAQETAGPGEEGRDAAVHGDGAPESTVSGDGNRDFLPGFPAGPRYATMLSARYLRGEVLLGFRPSGDAVHLVYRSGRPILEEDDLEEASAVAAADPGTGTVTDIPEQDGSYFYAVITEIPPGQRVVLVPYHNTLVHPVDFAPFPPGIERFQVSTEEGRVVVRFSPSRPGSSYRLYVSSRPFREIGSMQPARTVQDGGDRFTLELEPGEPAYFAITEVNRLGVENRDLVPGVSLSEEPFVPEKPRPPAPGKPEEPPARDAAAPPEPPEKPLPAEAPPRPRNYDRELDRNIRTNFITGRHELALAGFKRLLGEDLNERQRGRASFYAGQSAFYLGRYREALRLFIISKESSGYRDMAELWLQRCLERLETGEAVR